MNWPLQNLGELDRALKNCRHAESVARSLENPVLLGKVLYQYAQNNFFKNQYKTAEQYFQQALEQLEGNGEDTLISYVKFWLAISYFAQGKWKKAEVLYSEIIRAQEADNTQTKYLGEQPYLPYTISCTHLGYIHALQGGIKEAKELVQKSHAPALEQIANLQSRVWCAIWHSSFSTLVGEDHGALLRVEQVLKTAEETASPILCFLCFSAKGNALMATEQFEAARVVYEKALQAIEGTTYRRLLETVYHNLVQVTLSLGDWSEAERYYQAGLPLVQLSPEKDTPRYNFLKGRLLECSSQPDFEQAEDYFSQSILADEKSGAVVPAAQTSYYLARMLARKGEVGRARDMFTDLSSHFQSWSIPVWQQKCEQELETMESQT